MRYASHPKLNQIIHLQRKKLKEWARASSERQLCRCKFVSIFRMLHVENNNIFCVIISAYVLSMILCVGGSLIAAQNGLIVAYDFQNFNVSFI